MGIPISRVRVTKKQYDPIATKEDLEKTLEGIKALKDQSQNGSEDYILATKLEEVITDDLETCKDFEEMTGIFLEELSRKSTTGNPGDVRRFLNLCVERVATMRTVSGG